MKNTMYAIKLTAIICVAYFNGKFTMEQYWGYIYKKHGGIYTTMYDTGL